MVDICLCCVPPLPEIALRQIHPLLSISRFSVPIFPLPVADIIMPSSSWPSSGPLSVSHLPLSTSYCPYVVVHAWHVSSPLPFWFSLFISINYGLSQGMAPVRPRGGEISKILDLSGKGLIVLLVRRKNYAQKMTSLPFIFF